MVLSSPELFIPPNNGVVSDENQRRPGISDLRYGFSASGRVFGDGSDGVLQMGTGSSSASLLVFLDSGLARHIHEGVVKECSIPCTMPKGVFT